VALSDGQFGALVSFAFNLGAGNLGQSTLLRLLNGGDHAGAAEQFLRWNMGTLNGVKQPLAGLTRRRKAERAMFLGQDWRAAGDVRGAKKRTAKKAAAKTAPRQPSSRARTTTPTAPPPAPPAARRSRQKTR
jgi:lysozyme